MRFDGICFIAFTFFRWRCLRCASGPRIFRCWPGNLRELRNVVERLVLLAGEAAVSGADVRRALPGASGGTGGASGAGAESSGTLADRTEAFEKEVLLAEIRRHNFHMTNVARALGLERSHLYKKCQQLGIHLQSLRKPE